MVQPVAEMESRSRSLDEIKSRLQLDWTREQALIAAKAEAEAMMSNAKFLTINQKLHLSGVPEAALTTLPRA